MCVRLDMYVHTYTFTHDYVHTYIYVHTYTYTSHNDLHRRLPFLPALSHPRPLREDTPGTRAQEASPNAVTRGPA